MIQIRELKCNKIEAVLLRSIELLVAQRVAAGGGIILSSYYVLCISVSDCFYIMFYAGDFREIYVKKDSYVGL